MARVISPESELERFKATRVTALYRLDLIEKGAQLTYDDGTPVDMASEAQRLKNQVADMDRRIARLEVAGEG
ncbi:MULTISPECIES: hypothetical protein [Brevundimonas]|jgi:hypothetical protein|uniref:hypothetical protein n=1 Tax=Brevundimonas TaxID=41275 RepID=UPI0019064636|nr:MULTISPECIES: hypothetical protein [Brevundimonas]MDA0743548.1 hypothetical protein [Pseudomonadota bacterium]MBK1970546.1 hypothetical protein [Brevundimonas diminuta]MBK1976755.1 hypothetical protein [Brevundimonas diminuta]MDA1320975.1 hypothetical protein [Pseudomonadota bacterium]MDM8352752.1 hypothetical protein [Brevundimonas diminuta]